MMNENEGRDLQQMIQQAVKDELDSFMIEVREMYKGNHPLGVALKPEQALELIPTVNSVQTLMRMGRQRHTAEGVPCTLGRKNKLVFYSAALVRWVNGEDCVKLTQWIESFNDQAA